MSLGLVDEMTTIPERMNNVKNIGNATSKKRFFSHHKNKQKNGNLSNKQDER